MLKRHYISPVVALIVAFLLSGTAFGGTYYVPDAFATIQAALSVAGDGDVVIVRDGTYTGVGNRNLDFNGRGILLRSENGPADCIIDCESSGRAFIFNKGETSASVVEGFTITNGYVFGGGGAIYCYLSSPTVVNCIITRSSASGFGGGMACTKFSLPTFTDCEFIGNSAVFGGAIHSNDSSLPSINNCTFGGNSADVGGAIYCRNSSSPAVTNSILWHDIAAKGPEIAIAVSASLAVDFSDVEGGQSAVYVENGSTLNWGTGNVEGDPLFVDADSHKYHLGYGSPCINAGTSDGVVGDGVTDMGAYPAVTVDDDPGQNYGTIQEALNDPALSEEWGGSVIVYAGSYAENVSMRSTVSLLGAGPDFSVLMPPDSISFVGVSKSCMSGFTIRDAVDGIRLNDSSPLISHNVFIGCLSSAVNCEPFSSPLIIHNTIGPLSGDGIVAGPDASPIIVNNIIFDVTHGINADANATPLIDYNDIWNSSEEPYLGCSPGPHDISTDPIFEGTPGIDYHLHICSPCIDAGDPVELLTLDYIATSLEIWVTEVTNIAVGDPIWITDGGNIESDTVAGLDAGVILIEDGFRNHYLVADGSYVYSRYSGYSHELEPSGGRVNMGASGNTSEATTSEYVTDDDLDTYSECQGDCDDAHADVNPGAQEICNGIDDDCDELVDGDDPSCTGFTTYYRDDDEDEYGMEADSQQLCDPAFPYTAVAGGDCDDGNADVNPGAQEICNGIDDDCDELVDADDPSCIGVTTYYRDDDEDEYGVDADSQQRCHPEFPYTAVVVGDCDDTASTVYPGAPEVACDGIDQDCDDSDLCSCRIVVEGATAAPGDLVLLPVRLETSCTIVDALGLDFDYTDCYLRGDLSFTGYYVRGDLTAGWDFLDVSETAPGIVRVGGFTVADPILEGETGIIVELEFEIIDCFSEDTCGNTLTNLVSDIGNWPVLSGTFACDCPRDGDVDEDGQVTPGDALLAFQHYLGLVQLTECEIQHADVDEDGQVTPADALCIFQCYLGIPCPDLCP